MSLISTFPSGFANGLTIRGLPVTMAHPGRVFWVGNSTSNLLPGQKGASNSNDGTMLAPWSTVDYAIGQCVAGRGDVIMVRPGHAENLTAASAITSDVAGVAIVGLGTGAAAPTFTWATDTAATWVVSAANCSFVNLRFINNLADVVTMFSISGTADGLTFQDCFFSDTSTILNAIDFITLATGADNFAMVNCRMIGESASNDSFITGVAHNGFILDNCFMSMNVAQTAVVGLVETTGNATNVWVKDCMFRSNVDGALFLDFDGAANSGGITNCYFSSIDTSGAVTACIDFTGGHVFECYVAGDADSFGLVGGGTVYSN